MGQHKYDVTFTNNCPTYGSRYGSHTALQGAHPWLDGEKLVEPFKETVVAVSAVREDPEVMGLG